MGPLKAIVLLLYCIVLYCIVLYCIVLYGTVRYGTVRYGTVRYGTVRYGTVRYGTVLYCTVLYCTVLYCTVLYCTVCTVCTVLYCALYCSPMQEAQMKAVVAKNLAADYLARHFDALFNSFDVCLVTYALHEANHVSKGEVFRKMRAIKISGQ